MAQLSSAALLGGRLAGPAKLDTVAKLLDKLTEDLKSATLLPQERDAALEELKVYGRDPSYADPIFTKDGIGTLASLALDSSSDTTSRNALRVLCNAMFLKPETRQIFVDVGYEPKACRKLKAGSREDEFLVSRLLFLTTYGTTVDLPKLLDQHQLADSIIQNLSRHASRFAAPSATPTEADPMERMALEETLKLLFNITRYANDHVGSFGGAIPPIATILCGLNLPQSQKTPLEPPFGLLINALMNLDLSSPTAHAALYPESEPTRVIGRLIQLLDLAMKAYSDAALEQAVTPLVCVLSAAHASCPVAGAARALVRDRLLPTAADRKRVLGQADTLPSRLLRNWTNPLAPEFRKVVAHLYFDLSGKDAARFVENVGYGYASGFLFENKIPVPESAVGRAGDASSCSSSAAAAATGTRRPVNPITGQFLDEESFPDIPEMTTEEKEREAERLFVLFERLKQTGVVSVQNPVEKAVQEGRFEELPDDDDLVEDVD